MIDARVSLNGQEHEVLVPGDIYDAERLDYNYAVERALRAHKLKFPLDPIDVASVRVVVERVNSERASHDGEGTDTDRAEFTEDDNVESGDSANRQERDERADRNAEDLHGRPNEDREDFDENEDPDEFSDEELEELTSPDDDEDEQSVVAGSEDE